jgi:hypothetical protein
MHHTLLYNTDVSSAGASYNVNTGDKSEWLGFRTLSIVWNSKY